MADDKLPTGDNGQSYQGQILGTDDNGVVRKIRVDADGDLMVEAQLQSTSDNAGRQASNTVFGDAIVGIRKPSIASQFVYGVPSNSVIATLGGSSIFGVEDSMFYAKTGTTIGSTLFLKTRKALRYIPGFQAYLHGTPTFTEPVVGTYQWAGLGDELNGFAIGFDEDGDFCIRHRRAGVDVFVKQQDFNRDKIDGTGNSGFDINPTFGNVYTISYGYLGYANITFEVLAENNKWVTFHVIEYVNKHKLTHLANTYLPIFTEISNGTTNADLKITTGSLEAGIVDGGGVDVTGRSFGVKRDGVNTGTNTPLILFHNKTTFGGKTNFIPALLTLISASSEGAQNVNITLYKIPSSAITSATWQDVSVNSTMEYSINPVINTAGINTTWEFLVPINLAKSDSATLTGEPFDLNLYPNEYALFIANGNSVVNIANRWRELF